MRVPEKIWRARVYRVLVATKCQWCFDLAHNDHKSLLRERCRMGHGIIWGTIVDTSYLKPYVQHVARFGDLRALEKQTQNFRTHGKYW